MPTHESEQLRRLSPPAARAAPPASPRPFPQPDPSPQSPSSVTSPCRVLTCKVSAPSVVPGRVIGQKRIDRNLGRRPMVVPPWSSESDPQFVLASPLRIVGPQRDPKYCVN